MIPLYQHQKKIIEENKLKCGIFTGTGSAKTRTALHLAEGKILVICPKQQKLDGTWERNAEKFDIECDLTIVSKEELRRDYKKLPAFDTVIIDECHNNFGVLPETRQRNKVQIPKTSQIFEATLLYLKSHPPKRLYLCSATPVSKPMNMWAIAILLGESWSFLKFRDEFYFPIRIGQRRIYMPRKDEFAKQRLADLVKRFGYTGSLNDFFDVPDQTHKTVYIDLTEAQKEALSELMHNEADPLVRRARQRTIENGVLYGKQITSNDIRTDTMQNKTILFPSNKIDYILTRAIEFPKLLIFANYIAQINEIARILISQGYNVKILTGATKDRATLIQDAEKASECIVIAQCSISSGYELPSFPCAIYASKSWRYVDYEQSLGRILRSNALKKNLYIHLIVKGADEDCHNSIMSGVDFQEKLSINEKQHENMV